MSDSGQPPRRRRQQNRAREDESSHPDQPQHRTEVQIGGYSSFAQHDPRYGLRLKDVEKSLGHRTIT